MKLYSRPFEKSLRRGVRRAVKESPSLKKEFKQSKSFRRKFSATFWLRALVSLVIGFLVCQIRLTTGHTATALALLSLLTLVTMLFRSAGFLSCMFADADLGALAWLPVESTGLVRHQFQKFLGQSLLFAGDFAAGLIALGLVESFSAMQWLAAGLAALTGWVISLAAAIFFAERIPRVVTTTVGLMSVGLFASWLLHYFIPAAMLLGFLDRHATTLNLLLPTGWSQALLLAVLEPGHWANLWLLVPMGLLLWVVRQSFARLRAGYLFAEQVLEPAADRWPTEELPEEAIEDAPNIERRDAAPPKHFGVTAIEEAVMTRQFLAVPAWAERGWLERQMWRWFTPREKVLAELAFPEGVQVTARWKKVFRNLAVGLAIGVIVGMVSPAARLWAVGLGLFSAIVLGLAVMLDTGRVFQGVFCSGVNIPLYSAFAVGYRELARMFFKYTAVQLAPMLLCCGVGGVAVGLLVGLHWWNGALHGLRAGLLIFSWRYALLVFNFSGGTNDSACGFFRSAFLVLAVVGLAILYFVLGLMGLFLPRHLLAFGITLVATLFGYGLFRAYGWFYHKNRFDLMSLPRR